MSDRSSATAVAPTICIDGHNLALPEGTGIATYGFGLAQTARAMGFGVEGLFDLATGTNPETLELLFFEQFGLGERPNHKQMRRAVARAILMPWRSPRTFEVPQTGLVETRAFADRLPAFDRILNSPFLFQIAKTHFEIFGRFLELAVPHPPSVMHWTYPLPIRVRGAKNIYTFHDLIPLRLPYTTRDNKRYYHRLIETCVEIGDHICTVSEASKRDIVARFPTAESKITNTYQISPIAEETYRQSTAENASVIEAQFGLKHRGFFLFFGAIDPKKNIPRIIEAYLAANVDTPLVMIASRDLSVKDGSGVSAADRLFGNAGTRIRHLEYLPRATLLRLVQSAKAVVFPSLFEGFGLPALEAIQLGTPVISSNVSSLPEVVGAAGLLVDPYQVGEIAAAIRRVDADAELREQMTAAAPAQAAKYSSDRYRERLDLMYASVLG